MPEGRLERTRRSLPSGYCFGDARLPTLAMNYIASRHTGDKVFDQALRRKVLSHWNVIEGENHDMK